MTPRERLADRINDLLKDELAEWVVAEDFVLPCGGQRVEQSRAGAACWGVWVSLRDYATKGYIYSFETVTRCARRYRLLLSPEHRRGAPTWCAMAFTKAEVAAEKAIRP